MSLTNMIMIDTASLLSGPWHKKCFGKISLFLFVWSNQQVSSCRQTSYWKFHQHSRYLWFWIIWGMFEDNQDFLNLLEMVDLIEAVVLNVPINCTLCTCVLRHK